MPWGLQRMGNGLVAVCVESHDKREGIRSASPPRSTATTTTDKSLGGTEVNDEPRAGASAPSGPATEVKGGTACRRSAPLTEGHDAPSMWASDQEAMDADRGVTRDGQSPGHRSDGCR